MLIRFVMLRLRYPAILVATLGTIGLGLLLHGCSGDHSTGPPRASPSADVVPDALLGSVLGQWSAVMAAPIVQLHLHLLPSGKVLSWGRLGDPQVWDPPTGVFTAMPSPSWLFCAGHDFLPDGRLLVAGGHITDGHGLPNTNLFDATTGSWQTAPPMAEGRWYPTNTTLPDGEVLTLAGTDSSGGAGTG